MISWILIVALNSGYSTATVSMQGFKTERSCKVVALTVKDMSQYARVKCVQLTKRRKP